MAASSPFPSTSTNTNFLVTQPEFKAFHNIDRSLYSRLVLVLRRDPVQSMEVMALWIFLERAGYGRYLVHKISLSLPNNILNSLVDESLLCLTCIETTDLHRFINSYFSLDTIRDVPLLASLTKPGLTLQLFHKNQLNILYGVKKIINEVCVRAFDDILQVEGVNARGTVVQSSMVARANSNMTMTMSSCGSGGQVGFVHGLERYDVGVKRQILNNEIGDDVLRRTQTIGTYKEEEIAEYVPVDDRTIFLTFSKGYPISEDEVRDFFTRRYGDCIEAIHMQEVIAGEDQPLYARLIVQSPALIQVILEGMSKAKFSINGKHAWARKYVRKNTNKPSSLSPPQATSPSPSQPPSPI